MICSVKHYSVSSFQPSRPAGQRSVVGLAAQPMERVRVGFVGLGQRGREALMRWCHLARTDIVAVCDLSADRVADLYPLLRVLGRPAPLAF